MSTTLFDKVWDSHVVRKIEDGPDVLFIDRHLIHEVTSPVAFLGLKSRSLIIHTVVKPGSIFQRIIKTGLRYSNYRFQFRSREFITAYPAEIILRNVYKSDHKWLQLHLEKSKQAIAALSDDNASTHNRFLFFRRNMCSCNSANS